MKRKLNNLWTLKQEVIGPLVESLNPFVKHLLEQGYCRQYIGAQIRTVANFSRWLHVRKIAAHDITPIHASEYFQGTERRRVVKQGQVATLGRFIEFLQHLGVSQPALISVEQSFIQQLIDAYGDYLINVAGLSNKTLLQYKPIIEHFLTHCFGNGAIELSALTGKDIVEYVQLQANVLSTARAKVTTNAIRSLLRYAAYHGDVSIDLVGTVPTVAAWTMSGLPRAISAEHIEAILIHCDRETPIGRRDYAILMILAYLGLRAGEIVALTLDDIDWTAGSIKVAGKGGQSDYLPIPNQVGAAIADYLQHGRPQSNERSLFLRTIAPIRGLGAQQSIATIVNTAITRAGIDTPSRGAHQFRHAVAANLLRQGATLTEIASLLRHKHTKTTNIYAKVDLASLRSLSVPWPGGAQ